MAGIAALLDQKTGVIQGTLNPTLYALATSTPSAFHDTTVASSGVSSCSVSTASMCNNSVPLLGGIVQQGYLVGTGYDEVTGLGSLDVGAFLNRDSRTAGPLSSIGANPPAVNVGNLSTVTVTLSAGAPAGGAVVTLSSSDPTAFPVPASVTVASGLSTFSFNVQAGTVSASTGVTLWATYNGVTRQGTVTVNPVGVNATFTVTGVGIAVTAGATAGNSSAIVITPRNGFAGSVVLTAQVTNGASGAVNLPTVSFGATTPVNITVGNTGEAIMTITTTASSTTSCVASNEPGRGIPWYAEGGAVLACVLIFGIRPKRRRLRALLGALILLAVLAGGVDGMRRKQIYGMQPPCCSRDDDGRLYDHGDRNFRLACGDGDRRVDRTLVRDSKKRPHLYREMRPFCIHANYFCVSVVMPTGPRSPEGSNGESALYGAKSVNVYFFTAYDC